MDVSVEIDDNLAFFLLKLAQRCHADLSTCSGMFIRGGALVLGAVAGSLV